MSVEKREGSEGSREPKSLSPSVWSVTSVCQPKCMVSYLCLSAQMCGRLPLSVSQNVWSVTLSVSPSVWSVTSVCQLKCVVGYLCL